MKMIEIARRELDLYLEEKRKENANYTGKDEEAAYEAFKSLLSCGHSGNSIEVTKCMIKDMSKGVNIIRPSSPKDNEFDYFGLCYESAMDAYKIMQECCANIDSANSLLVKLVDGDALTPIEDIPDIWGVGTTYGKRRLGITYQCQRMTSLFKHVDKNGVISYTDVDRVTCVDVNDANNTYYFGLADDVVNEMHPIKFPYLPEKYTAYCEDFLVDKRNGDFDTFGIFDLENRNGIEPVGEFINRFFKSDVDDTTSPRFGRSYFIEIDEAEYNERKKRKS